MKYKILLIIIGTTFLFFISSITAITATNIQHSKNFDGYILFTPEFSKKTFLINSTGDIIRQWESNYIQALPAYLLENGNILRGDMPYPNPTFFGGGITGQVEIFDWDGELIWNYILSNNQYCLHHDIEPLPNGNILMIAWEYKSRSEAIYEGRNPDYLGDNMWADYIFEIEPFTNNIVWEWSSWDHLIQDYDPTKQNYGDVGSHPELIDINLPQHTTEGDWLHINSIDYNEELDQILICSCYLDEIFIIDHKTNSILYRWGNPQNYRALGDRQFFHPHDARWIEPNHPGEGNILVFNNGVNRPDGDYSTVDEIVPPVDGDGNYYLEPGSSYGPEEPVWIYDCNFYALYISGAQRLSSGNTLICNGPIGKFIEVTPAKEIVWEYVNPYPNYYMNDVFTIQYYSSLEKPESEDLDCEGSLNWKNVKPKDILNGFFKVKNIGEPDSLLDWKIVSYPDWGIWSFNPESGENLTPEDGQVTVQISVIAPDEKNKKFEGYIIVENQENSEDFDVIPIYLTTPRNKISVNSFFLLFLDQFPILQKLLYFII